MGNWLRLFDRTSFWLGFLAATLLWWLVSRFRPQLSRLLHRFLEQAKVSRVERSQSDEIRIGNDVLRKAQGWHLAAPLFSLDEIITPVRLLAPAPPPYAYEPPPSSDITDWAIPYTPDDPEFASSYNAPQIEASEALSGGANLVLIGAPGSGKTVALAHLACQLIRKPPSKGTLPKLVPILIHVGELDLPLREGMDAEGVLYQAVVGSITSVSSKRLPGVYQTLLKQARLLLLLDGLDELSPPQMEQTSQFLKSLLEKYPSLRAVVTAHPGNLGGLTALGFHPVAMANWSKAQRAILISRWSELWDRYIAESAAKAASADPLLLVGWLLNNSSQLTPLELTLKIWAAFAGDALGPGALAGIEAYLRRMLANQPAKNRLGLEHLAAQMALSMEPLVGRRLAERWLGGAIASETIQLAETQPIEAAEGLSEEEKIRQEKIRAGGALPDLLACGLVVARAGERISIAHPLLAAYLASQRLASQRLAGQLAAQPDWCIRATGLKYLAILDSRAEWMNEFLKAENNQLLQYNLIQAGRWLQNAPEGLPWIPQVMRGLALCVQKAQLPIHLRARAISALTLSNDSNIPQLLRQFLGDQQAVIRQLAALALGYLRDTKSVEALIKLIGDTRFSDNSPGVSRAALLALVAIGNRDGLEAVAYTMLHADDDLRRAAAEALANDPEEGYPALQEGSAVEDAAVRRAVVFGLGRLGLPWATEILRKMSAEDSQWFVQDAAIQALQTVENPHPRIPKPLLPLPQTPWLIAFAAERGMGVAPGRPAYEMLRRALKEGNPDQKMAALYYLGLSADLTAIPSIYQLYSSSQGELRETAFTAIWNMALCGLPLPPPSETEKGN